MSKSRLAVVLILGAACLPFLACGKAKEHISPLRTGTYVAEAARRPALPDTRLSGNELSVSVDLVSGYAVISGAGVSLKRPLVKLAPSESHVGCATGKFSLFDEMSIIRGEAFSLGEPIDLAGIRFNSPVLTSFCIRDTALITERGPRNDSKEISLTLSPETASK
ncbi:MAG: hypothetical protein WBV82_19645 [Myxococcaceae bacterium]